MSKSVEPSPAVHVKPVYSIPEFCHDFATSRSVAYEEIRAGRLNTFKNGAATRITGENALAWRNAKCGPPDMDHKCKRRPGRGGAAVVQLADKHPKNIKSSYVTPAPPLTPQRLRELNRIVDGWAGLPPSRRRAVLLGQAARP